MIIPSMPSGMIALRYGFQGVNYATTSACASSIANFSASFAFNKFVSDTICERYKLTQDDTMTITTKLTQSPGMVAFMTDFQDIITMIQIVIIIFMSFP